MRIKIIYLVPYLIKSGPINVLYNIVKHLDRTKFTPIIVTLSRNTYPLRDNKAWFTDLGIEVIEYNYSNWYLQFHVKAVAKDLEKRLNDKNVIFHAHGYYPTLVLSRMRRAETMTTIHNFCSQDFVMQKGRVMGTYMSWMYKRALKHIGLCVPICNSMKEYYYRDNHRLNLHTIYNGVDPGREYSDSEKLAIRQELGIPPHVKVLLYPAGFSFRKNQKGIIEDVRTCSRKDLIILFAGQGETESECKRLVGDDPRFRFLGYQMNMEKYWAVTDFLISASRSEGLPMAVLEALVQGIPCILSEIAPHQELLQQVLQTDLLCFKLDDPISLSRVLEKSLDGVFDHDRIRKNAEIYTSKEMSRNYSEAYENISSKTIH